MNSPRALRSKIKSPKLLIPVLRRAQKKRKKIVFTNGCFDLLHKGHVSYLEKARAQGDVLVVALNSDQSVKNIKGPTRPINTLADRAWVMAALESVDYVTWFNENDPVNLIRTLRPDVLVKGGDWKVHQILGSEDVLSWGGKVKSLKYLKGHSTTETIKRASEP